MQKCAAIAHCYRTLFACATRNVVKIASPIPLRRRNVTIIQRRALYFPPDCGSLHRPLLSGNRLLLRKTQRIAAASREPTATVRTYVPLRIMRNTPRVGVNWGKFAPALRMMHSFVPLMAHE